MMELLYIDGEMCQGDEPPREVRSPASGSPIAQVAWASATDAERALEAAQRAFPWWSSVGIDERAQWMSKLRDAVIDAEVELREAVQLETGKTWEHSEEDYQMLVDSLQFYADAARDLTPEDLADREGTYDHQLVREPVGVAVAFIAWNFPLLNLAFKLGPAMAAGCPIIIKPSIKTPVAAFKIGRLCHEIGLPAGVVNILCGDDDIVGDTLSASTIPALLTLIGSMTTGRHIMRVGSTSVKRYSMELGGNAPAIVFEDADLDKAADVIATLKFAHAGQICVTPNRVLVHQDVAQDLTDRLVARAERVRVGTGGAGEIDMGSLIDERAARRVQHMVEEAVEAGARLILGGRVPDDAPTNCYLEPTILDGIKRDMRVYAEEIFGPVIGITAFSSEEEAMEWANESEAGLTAFVFTEDDVRIARTAERLRFGEVHINGVKHAIELPHGGIKQSGFGHDCSVLALDDYLAYKRVSRPTTPAG